MGTSTLARHDSPCTLTPRRLQSPPLSTTKQGRTPHIRGLILTMIGTGLTLPFFGVEAFGLQVIGQQAVAQNSPNALTVANLIRFGPAIWFIIVGLLIVGLGAVLFGSAVWSSGTLPKWSGVLLALGFALYIPQLSVFASNQLVRVADGLLIAVGCLWLAWSMLKPYQG